MSMRGRLDDLPIFEYRDSHVDANQYNLVHIALKRLGKSLRFELPRLRTLDMVLEKEAWAVIDRDLNDIPVIAWVDFQTRHRDNLHEPIRCQQRLYHAHALIIVGKVMEAMHDILGEKLAIIQPTGDDKITKLKRPE